MERALDFCAELKGIFRLHAGGWLDRHTLERVRALCEAAAQATDDSHCRVELARLAHQAIELYSHRGGRRDLLRERILLTLESIEDRLYSAHWRTPAHA